MKAQEIARTLRNLKMALQEVQGLLGSDEYKAASIKIKDVQVVLEGVAEDLENSEDSN
jgi:hypothetical protein